MGIRLHHCKYLGISMAYKIRIASYIKAMLNQALNISLCPTGNGIIFLISLI